MEFKCPECGQKIDGESLKGNQQVECPSCFFHFDMPESITAADPEEVAEEMTPDSYRKKGVRTNVILDDEAIVAMNEAARKRSVYTDIKGWQYVVLAIGILLAALVWGFLKLEEFFRSTFISGMDLTTQQLLAGFFGLVAGGLIWFASRNRLWPFRFLAIGVVVGLPLSVTEWKAPEGNFKETDDLVLADIREAVVPDAPVPDTIDDYREIDLAPLFQDIANLGPSNVLGVWVRGVNNLNQNQLLSYLKRMSRINGDPKFFERKPGGLFVINKSDLTFKEFLEILQTIGTVELTDEPSRFVDLKLNQSLFPEPPPVAMLQDASHEYFIEANYKELCSFDMKRIEAAARRLAKEAPPEEMRGKVIAQLDKLINEPWGHDANYLTGLIMAFAVWSPADNDKAQEQVAYVCLKLIEANKDVPEGCVAFMLKGKRPFAAATFMEAWRKDPARWENDLMAFGAAAEKEVLGAVEGKTISGDLAASALRILEQVGTERSLVPVRQMTQGKDPEMAALAKAALLAIEKRSPQPVQDKEESASVRKKQGAKP